MLFREPLVQITLLEEESPGYVIFITSLVSCCALDWPTRQKTLAISKGRIEPSLHDRATCTSSQGDDFNNGYIRLTIHQGPLAQSVERGADNAKVVSSRLTRTKFFSFNYF